MTNHGGAGSIYSNDGCRCPECTDAHTVRCRLRREERYATPKADDDPRHGKASFYSNWGCRCDRCTAAYAEHNRKHYERRKAKTS